MVKRETAVSGEVSEVVLIGVTQEEEGMGMFEVSRWLEQTRKSHMMADSVSDKCEVACTSFSEDGHWAFGYVGGECGRGSV